MIFNKQCLVVISHLTQDKKQLRILISASDNVSLMCLLNFIVHDCDDCLTPVYCL